MTFIKHSLIFIFRLLWIFLKYSPILIAWLFFGTVVIDLIMQPSATPRIDSEPPMSTGGQLVILLGIWFFITGLAAIKTLSK